MSVVVPNSPYDMVTAMVGLIFALEVAIKRGAFPDGDEVMITDQINSAKATIAWAEPEYRSPAR